MSCVVFLPTTHLKREQAWSHQGNLIFDFRGVLSFIAKDPNGVVINVVKPLALDRSKGETECCVCFLNTNTMNIPVVEFKQTLFIEVKLAGENSPPAGSTIFTLFVCLHLNLKDNFLWQNLIVAYW